jgi:hypothetical protein
MGSSFHSPIPFLPLFYNWQFRRLDSVQFLCSKTHIPAGWRLETQLALLNWTLTYNHFAISKQKTQPLCCLGDVFIAPLHNNGSYSIVTCVFVAARMCLPSRCLSMDIYSNFTLPVFGRYITILLIQLMQMVSLFMYFIYLMLDSASRNNHFKQQNEVKLPFWFVPWRFVFNKNTLSVS